MTFQATYKVKGSTASIVFAQQGAKTSFSTGTTAYYSDGATSTVCDSSNGTPSCSTGAKPLTGLLSLINPTQMSNAVLAATTSAVSVNHSTENHSGQSSSCVAYAVGLQRVKYCVNDQGVVTFIRIPTGTFELTAYTTNVSDAEVSVPAGAKFGPAPSAS